MSCTYIVSIPLRRGLAALCLVALPLFLTGCGKEDISLLSKDGYEIHGIEGNKPLKKYLEKIRDDRLAQPMAAGTGDERKLRADYRRRLLEDDLQAGLQAAGYYDAKVSFRASSEKAKEAVEGKGTRFEIATGKPYMVSRVEIKPRRFAAFAEKSVGLKAGDRLEAGRVLSAMENLKRNIQKDGCFLSLDIDHTVLLDPARQTGVVTFVVTAGEPAVYGDVHFEGLERVEEEYLRRKIEWKKGDCFKRGKIDDYRTELLQSGLFAAVDVQTPRQVPRGAPAPVTFTLKERAHRTLSAGMRYYTDEGAGFQFGWENRNMAGSAEKLSVNLKVTELQRALEAAYTKPDFGRKNQSLTFTSTIDNQTTDAYDQTGFKLGARIDRPLSKRLNASLGVEGQVTVVDDIRTNTETTFGLLSIPAALTYDSRNNALDPTRGWNASLQAAPFFDTLGETSPFVKSRATASTYLPLIGGDRLLLAVRGSLGSISGADIRDVPASERFYAGGGGSLRGFGFQEVGPSQGGVPAGGLSLVETNTELRLKLSDTIGVVTFVDAGNVSDQSVPNLDNLAVGVGAGVRYYTDFGPLRLDLATPLSKDTNGTRSYQFYISVGQAF